MSEPMDREAVTKMRDQLFLWAEAQRAAIHYDESTSFCSGCPGTESNSCCKNTGAWEEAHDQDYAFLQAIDQAHKAMQHLLSFWKPPF